MVYISNESFYDGVDIYIFFHKYGKNREVLFTTKLKQLAILKGGSSFIQTYNTFYDQNNERYLSYLLRLKLILGLN
jgi:hypothetical protein